MALFSANWAAWAASWFLFAASHALYQSRLMVAGFVAQCLGFYLMSAFTEYAEKERVGTLQTNLLTALVALYAASWFLPDVVVVVPGYGLHVEGVTRALQLALLVLYSGTYFRWVGKIWQAAGPSLKRQAGAMLAGTFLFAVVPFVLYALGTFN